MIYAPHKKLTKHFKMYEVSKSSIASRYGIDNTPGEIELDRAYELALNVLEPVREHFGIPFSPSSWFRCEELEKIIAKNGYVSWCVRYNKQMNARSWDEYFSKKSHPKGSAADIELPGIPNDDLWLWIRDNLLTYDQLIREFPKPNDVMSGWVHVSYDTINNRKQAFTIG